MATLSNWESVTIPAVVNARDKGELAGVAYLTREQIRMGASWATAQGWAASYAAKRLSRTARTAEYTALTGP